VFSQGSSDNLFFYIILQGSVAVYLENEKADVFGHRGAKEIAVLDAGCSFGDLALIGEPPVVRTATVTTRTKCVFATLDGAAYREMIGSEKGNELKEKVKKLIAVPFLKEWTVPALRTLVYHFKGRRYVWNQTVYKEDEVPNEVYLVSSGRYLMTRTVRESEILENNAILTPKRDPEWNKRRSKSIEKKVGEHVMQIGPQSPVHSIDVAIVTTGDVIGAEELVFGSLRQLTCRCISEDGELLVISKKDFFNRIMGDQRTLPLLKEFCEKKFELRNETISTALDSILKPEERERREAYNWNINRRFLHFLIKKNEKKVSSSEERPNDKHKGFTRRIASRLNPIQANLQAADATQRVTTKILHQNVRKYDDEQLHHLGLLSSKYEQVFVPSFKDGGLTLSPPPMGRLPLISPKSTRAHGHKEKSFFQESKSRVDTTNTNEEPSYCSVISPTHYEETMNKTRRIIDFLRPRLKTSGKLQPTARGANQHHHASPEPRTVTPIEQMLLLPVNKKH
jgi:CRP-like cAMP-binding protein